MKKQFFLFVIIMCLGVKISAQSDSPKTTSQIQTQQLQTNDTKSKHTFGVAIDLLPPIMSATTDNFGYSVQLWYGFDKFRVRGVIA